MQISPSINVTVPPAGDGLCISLDEANLQSRTNTEEEDSLVTSYIKAAQEAYTARTGRVILSTTFAEAFPSWNHACGWRGYGCYSFARAWNCWHPLKLGMGKVSAISSIAYYDADDSSQTLTGYMSDLSGVPAMIGAPESGFPALSTRRFRPITVTYVAGFANAAAVPEDIKQGIRSLVAHWYWTREAYGEVDMKAIPMGFEHFCAQWSTGREGF